MLVACRRCSLGASRFKLPGHVRRPVRLAAANARSPPRTHWALPAHHAATWANVGACRGQRGRLVLHPCVRAVWVVVRSQALGRGRAPALRAGGSRAGGPLALGPTPGRRERGDKGAKAGQRPQTADRSGGRPGTRPRTRAKGHTRREAPRNRNRTHPPKGPAEGRGGPGVRAARPRPAGRGGVGAPTFAHVAASGRVVSQVAVSGLRGGYGAGMSSIWRGAHPRCKMAARRPLRREPMIGGVTCVRPA